MPLLMPTVPESPAGIKAVVSSPSTILVTWLAPAKVNGVLTKYTLYMAITADQNRVGVRCVTQSGSQFGTV